MLRRHPSTKRLLGATAAAVRWVGVRRLSAGNAGPVSSVVYVGEHRYRAGAAMGLPASRETDREEQELASMILIVQTGLVLVLILANGVFAAAEMAVVSARPGRLRRMGDRGDPRAVAALDLVRSRSRFLSTVQIGITLVGTLASAVGGASLASALASEMSGLPLVGHYAPAIAMGVVVLVLTYLLLVFGELVPKRLALARPEKLAVVLATYMRLLLRAFGPLVGLLSASSDAVLRLFGQKPRQSMELTLDDIDDLVHRGTELGVLEPDVREIIERVLRVGARQARNLMTAQTELAALSVDQDVGSAVELIRSTGFHKIPIFEGSVRDVVGVVDARNLVGASPNDSRGVASVAQPVLVVPETLDALGLLTRMQESGRRMAVVIDEYGSTAGIVTLDDVLSEIFGEFGDELRPALEEELVARPDGSLLIDAGIDIEDLRERLGLDPFPGELESDYETLAGFVLAMLNRLPTIGERFEYGGYRFEVVDMDGNRVDRILVNRLPQGKNADGTD